MKVFNFLRRDDKFFSWFAQATKNNFLAAKELQKLCNEFKNPKKAAEEISDLEHKGDKICHAIFDELNKSFLTPLDREDLIELTHSVDDTIDLIHKSADDFYNYNIKKTTPTAVKLADTIVSSTRVIKEILPKIQKRKVFQEVRRGIYEVNRLETQADDLLREGLQRLFRKEKSPIDIIRWQAIYQTMEDVTDKCEDTADVLHGLIIKYA